MQNTSLRLIAAAAIALCMGQSALAAQPAADHPAVQRALAHLGGQALASAHGSGADAYSVRDLVVDADGSEHVRFARTHNGLRVIGGDLVVHSRADGSLQGLSLTQKAMIQLDLTPKVEAALAARTALAATTSLASAGSVKHKELVIYARGAQAQLAWDVRVDGVQPDGTPSQAHLIISATGNTLLDQWDEIETADIKGKGKTLYSGNVPLHSDLTDTTYTLKDLNRGGHYVVDMKSRQFGTGTVFTGTDKIWGDNTETSNETVAADAAYGQNMTWDYYQKTFGRNGIADDGQGAYSRVHYGRNYDNAFWSDDCFCMTYGDGNSFTPLVSLDVAGHEMTHGVTSRTAALIYSGESGGLNEGTSDIMGSMVEFFAKNENDVGDYLIGEELYPAGSGEALRYMQQPSKDGGSADCWYSGVGNLDVHYSSGVANHFYFLLAEGTTAGSPSKTCVSGDTKTATGSATLTGVGRKKAAKIWYRALTVYMTSSTDYAAARAATISAATDLFGETSPETEAVKAAWTAVNRS
ncbi:M4 family metallopeptidase [Ideonella azotifigens]|uniref:Neutral metalloproteinase n=1 Tax=Ideonella azotifigens TaxID=513160 RepID=A0ABP3VPQ3_9BURK|nr:M4 family metallopeptidase [Ideonella azotifigens]MCD2340415.1 M4 family metallopeptidase [Ideonella azotifigens]